MNIEFLNNQKNVSVIKKKEKICFLTDVLTIGGVEIVLLDALQFLNDKYDITIISLYYPPNPDILNKFPDGVKIICKELPRNKISLLLSQLPGISSLYYNKVFDDYYDYIVALKPDTMNCCFSSKGKKKIYWCHNDYHIKFAKSNLSIYEKIKKYILKFTYNKFDMIWTVSSNIADNLKLAFNKNNVYSLPNPINCQKILSLSEEKCEIEFNPEIVNIVMIGRLAAVKGFDRIVEILDKIVNKSVHLYIIGEGGERQKIKEIIKNKELNDIVTLLGARSNPFPFLKQASLFVCPSYIESFGLSIMEAMLLNVPVITTATTGGKYVTQNGKLAICVENNDSELEKSLKTFIENSTYDYSLSNAKTWVMHHDVKYFGCNILQLLNSDQLLSSNAVD